MADREQPTTEGHPSEPPRGRTRGGKVPEVTIRPATDEDWPRIWPFFSTIVDAGETYSYPDGLTAQSGRALWMEGPPGRTVVAVVDETVVGSAKMGPNRPGRGSHIATASFMVDPSFRGRGIGRALGADMIEWARAANYRGIQFNAVVETNVGALELWRSLGFRIVGTVPEAFDHATRGPVALHIMYRPL
jgi:L-amino acid N-acyltransferase YncA